MTRTATSTCSRPGCDTPVHGQGLCRIHYDELRYQRTTGRSPEAEAVKRREDSITFELCSGCVPEWTSSMFASDEERRAAWEERRAEIMEDYLASPPYPPDRPWAWWRYDSGWRRPKGAWDDDGGNELVVAWWLARNGHLTDAEIEQVRTEAADAEARFDEDARFDEEEGYEFEPDAEIHADDLSAMRLHRAVQVALEDRGRRH